jgi:hypothetical protein
MEKLIFVIVVLVSSFANASYCGIEQNPSDRLIAMTDPQGNLDYWDTDQAQDLSFCIGERFSDQEERVTEALRKAAQEWMKYANVDFQLRDDLSCAKNSNVRFRVIPAPRRAKYAARAFFPFYEKSRHVLRINRKHIQNHGEAEAFRLMLHELGHILGFRHEHIHPDQGGTCQEKSDGGFEPITDYDPSSVMHYPRCNAKPIKNFVLSELDKQGAGLAYPF